MMKTPAIGIDLGTTCSCVSVWQHGKVKIITNEQGATTTPSYVAFTDTERLIGEPAKIQVLRNPENTIFDVKRLIGRKFDDPIVQADMKNWPFSVINDAGKPKVSINHQGEVRQFTPEEISSMVLLKLKETAEVYLDSEVKDAVITVPAYFNDSQRQATKDAGVIAGLNVLRIINEPTAASLAYGLDQNLKGKRNVLTFDLGGGTFDVSVLTIDEGSLFEVKSTAGDTHLGGEDFDNRLVNHLAEEFKEKFKKDLTTNRRAVCRLRNAAERAKCTLSSCAVANIMLDSLYDGEDFYTFVTRPQFEDLCIDLFQATLATVQKALVDANIDKKDIDDLVLVGGSTRIPKVQLLLQNFFGGKSLKHSINPDEAVAYGAAVQAAALSKDPTREIQDFLLVDVTALSLGVEVKGGLMSTVIKRNTPLPCKITKGFVTTRDDQDSVLIQVYEGERATTADNNLLGWFELTGIPRKPKGEATIDETFEIDVNGILTVSAVERSSCRSNSIVIKNEKGRLSKEEINRMIEDAKRFKEEDEKCRARVEARLQLENYIYDVKQTVEGAGAKLSESEKKTVKEEIDNTLPLIKSPSFGLGILKHKLLQLKQVCTPIINKIY